MVTAQSPMLKEYATLWWGQIAQGWEGWMVAFATSQQNLRAIQSWTNTSHPLAIANPPPKSSTMFQGTFSWVNFQSSSGGGQNGVFISVKKKNTHEHVCIHALEIKRCNQKKQANRDDGVPVHNCSQLKFAIIAVPLAGEDLVIFLAEDIVSQNHLFEKPFGHILLKTVKYLRASPFFYHDSSTAKNLV